MIITQLLEAFWERYQREGIPNDLFDGNKDYDDDLGHYANGQIQLPVSQIRP